MKKNILIIVLLLLYNISTQGQSAKYYIVLYPNDASVLPLNDSTIITGDSIVNTIYSTNDVYQYEKIEIMPKYWPHAVEPHHFYLRGNADTLRERFLSTGHFDSPIYFQLALWYHRVSSTA